MGMKKSVNLSQDPMAEMDSGMSPRDQINQDFVEDPNAPAEQYQEDPEVIGAVNQMQKKAWELKVKLHQKEFDKEWSKMSPKKQEQYMADLQKQYEKKMARTRKVAPQPAAPVEPPKAIADDSTQGL